MSSGDKPGLQPERTSLSWQRTGLAVAVAAIIGLHILSSRLGPVAMAIGIVGSGFSVVIFMLAHRRYRELSNVAAEESQGEGIPGEPANVAGSGADAPQLTNLGHTNDGVLLLLVAFVITCGGVAGLWLVLAG